MKSNVVDQLKPIHQKLKNCRKCPGMCGRSVHGPAIDSKIMLIGQAPGIYEEERGRPFAHTAGKTLFKWLHQATGRSEENLRESIYISAVARCFPGKAKSGAGDREPTPEEIKNCSEHLRAEIEVLKPDVVLAVGKVAIFEVLSALHLKKTMPLAELVGEEIECVFHGHKVKVIPLPHPSGVSRWPQTEPGKTKLRLALQRITNTFGCKPQL